MPGAQQLPTTPACWAVPVCAVLLDSLAWSHIQGVQFTSAYMHLSWVWPIRCNNQGCRMSPFPRLIFASLQGGYPSLCFGSAVCLFCMWQHMAAQGAERQCISLCGPDCDPLTPLGAIPVDLIQSAPGAGSHWYEKGQENFILSHEWFGRKSFWSPEPGQTSHPEVWVGWGELRKESAKGEYLFHPPLDGCSRAPMFVWTAALGTTNATSLLFAGRLSCDPVPGWSSQCKALCASLPLAWLSPWPSVSFHRCLRSVYLWFMSCWIAWGGGTSHPCTSTCPLG